MKTITDQGIYKVTEMTDLETLQACMLTPQTIARLENEIVTLTDQLVNTRFAIGEPELNRQLAEFLYKQSRRETLVAMLEDCHAAYLQLANPTPDQTTGA